MNDQLNGIYLSSKPFYLNDAQIQWVKSTLDSMTLEEKVGQLFCVMIEKADDEELDAIYHVLRPGGCMYRILPLDKVEDVQKKLSQQNKTPLFVAANLEKGGNGVVKEGTLLGSPLQVAATNDPIHAYRLGLVCAKEAKAVGCHVGFSPIVDIDQNYMNPITNTRTFGSNPDTVQAMALAYIRALQETGLAATVKHFPGDGQDDRDQHLVTSVNGLSCEDWDASYGKIYKSCIDAGVMCCMAGHIMLPSYSKKLNPTLTDEQILPGSLSKELLQGLLREKLGFNGLIITDATTMAGFTIPLPRSQAVPMSIAAGADMFLFSRNLQEDYQFMVSGIENGTLSMERLHQAVTRILAMKAALHLHEAAENISISEAKTIIGCEEHQAWARECANAAITLVKEEKGVLPLTPTRYPRVLFYALESTGGAGRYKTEPQCEKLAQLFRNHGFQVDMFTPEPFVEGRMRPTSDVIDHYDLLVYAANLMTKSNQTTVRINWTEPMGANCPHFNSMIPTVFISLENPYHLLDVPRMKTFINTYSSHDTILTSLMEKLMGYSEFTGKSPVDPFCGRWDTHL